MTDVTPEDREAAWPLRNTTIFCEQDRPKWDAGLYDASRLLQGVATHREAAAQQARVEALREAGVVAEWLAKIAEIDLEEIVADGGVTAGMVVQQEARFMARKLAIKALIGDEG